MKKALIILLFLSMATFAEAQHADTLKTTTNDSSKFVPIDVNPQFPGGLEKFMKYLEKNEKAGDNNGKVRVSFVVEKDGSLSNIKIVESLSDSADKEAIRLISQSPKWVPAMQGGHPVRANYTIPIHFPAI